jgi:hypothetical protein
VRAKGGWRFVCHDLVKYSSDVPFFNRLDEIRSRSFEQQRYRASGLQPDRRLLQWRSSAKIGAGKFRPFRLLPPA